MAISNYVLRKRQTFFLKDRHIPAVYWEGKTPWCMVYMQHKGPRMKYLCGQLPAHYPMPCVYYGKDNPQFWTFRFKFEARYKMGVRQ